MTSPASALWSYEHCFSTFFSEFHKSDRQAPSFSFFPPSHWIRSDYTLVAVLFACILIETLSLTTGSVLQLGPTFFSRVC